MFRETVRAVTATLGWLLRGGSSGGLRRARALYERREENTGA